MGVVPQTSTIYEVLEELAIAVQARAVQLCTVCECRIFAQIRNGLLTCCLALQHIVPELLFTVLPRSWPTHGNVL